MTTTTEGERMEWLEKLYDEGWQLVTVDMPGALVELGISPSKRHAKNLIAAGAVKIDGVKVTDYVMSWGMVEGRVLRCGRFQVVLA